LVGHDPPKTSSGGRARGHAETGRVGGLRSPSPPRPAARGGGFNAIRFAARFLRAAGMNTAPAHRSLRGAPGCSGRTKPRLEWLVARAGALKTPGPPRIRWRNRSRRSSGLMRGQESLSRQRDPWNNLREGGPNHGRQLPGGTIGPKWPARRGFLSARSEQPRRTTAGNSAHRASGPGHFHFKGSRRGRAGIRTRYRAGPSGFHVLPKGRRRDNLHVRGDSFGPRRGSSSISVVNFPRRPRDGPNLHGRPSEVRGILHP